MVRAHVALTKGLWLAGQCDGGGVARVALRAAPDGSIRIGRPDVMTSEAPGLNRRRAFQRGESIGWPVDGAWVEPSSERDLIIRQLGRATHRRPS
jgi:hypothetical protein